jgi:hypothetical protein
MLEVHAPTLADILKCLKDEFALIQADPFVCLFCAFSWLKIRFFHQVGGMVMATSRHKNPPAHAVLKAPVRCTENVHPQDQPLL